MADRPSAPSGRTGRPVSSVGSCHPARPSTRASTPPAATQRSRIRDAGSRSATYATMPATIAASVVTVTTAFCATTSVEYRVTASCRATSEPAVTNAITAGGARYPARTTAGRAHGWFGVNRSASTNTAPQATEYAPTVFRKYTTGPGPPTASASGGNPATTTMVLPSSPAAATSSG